MECRPEPDVEVATRAASRARAAPEKQRCGRALVRADARTGPDLDLDLDLDLDGASQVGEGGTTRGEYIHVGVALVVVSLLVLRLDRRRWTGGQVGAGIRMHRDIDRQGLAPDAEIFGGRLVLLHTRTWTTWTCRVCQVPHMLVLMLVQWAEQRADNGLSNSD